VVGKKTTLPSVREGSAHLRGRGSVKFRAAGRTLPLEETRGGTSSTARRKAQGLHNLGGNATLMLVSVLGHFSEDCAVRVAKERRGETSS